jgi:hypothetical protein
MYGLNYRITLRGVSAALVVMSSFALVSAADDEEPAGVVGSGFLRADNPYISVVMDAWAWYNFDFEEAEPGEGGEDQEDASEYHVGIKGAEVQFYAPIDPYGSAYAMVAYHEGEFDLEEAYGVWHKLPGIPASLSGGRMRSLITKQNNDHAHALPLDEYPLCYCRFWGDEGLVTDGGRFSLLIPLPFYSEVLAEGADWGAFGKADEFFEMGDNFGVEVEAAYLYHKDYKDLGVGAAKFKWVPSTRALYRSLSVRGDVISSLGGNDKIGYAATVDFQFAKRWRVAFRYDKVDDGVEPYFEHHHDGDQEHEHELTEVASTALSFMPTEFQYIRVQYDHPLEPSEGKTIYVLWDIILGPHRAHAY